MTLIEQTIAAVRPLDAIAQAEASEHQLRLTKPAGSLGEIEAIATRLAGIAAASPPPVPEPVALAVFCGDHGVHAQGVTPWPREVTMQMAVNFLAGGAMTSVIARSVDASVVVVDLGLAGDLDEPARTAEGAEGRVALVSRKIARGTEDIYQGPAMSGTQCRRAVEAGIDVAADLVAQGHRLLATGDLGIGNTTPSAALVSVFTGAAPAEVTGRGTGIDDATLARKIVVVERAIARNGATPQEPLRALAGVGGYEHGGLVGFLLGAAALRVPVVLDGVIAASAALVAAALCPAAAAYWFAGHVSAEPASRLAIAQLGLRPLLDLGMRLGEGSGALLAVPVVQAAARVHREGATFESAAVAGRCR